MPWELQALPANESGSLGTIEQVQATLRAAVPEVKLFRDISGLEKIAETEARGAVVPNVIREHWLRSTGAYQGEILGDRFTIELYLGEDEAKVTKVVIEVRGSGNPIPVIQRLMQIPGWTVADLRGVTPSLESWRSFGTWRDDAIQQIEERE